MSEEQLKEMGLIANETREFQDEIDTLNKNIERKDLIIAGLCNIIMNTKDVELIKQSDKVMIEANFGGVKDTDD